MPGPRVSSHCRWSGRLLEVILDVAVVAAVAAVVHREGDLALAVDHERRAIGGGSVLVPAAVLRRDLALEVGEEVVREVLLLLVDRVRETRVARTAASLVNSLMAVNSDENWPFKPASKQS